ncbi:MULTISPECIES: hypothetical protein [Actinoalloteichus]|uniref:Uncharacterized protein n=1 Tax=Actinoalloteichus fjordicus TaxID=1612552 RepID=A0AAC9LFB2_9PSEU|nr:MULTISPECIES: hypothetical protein [Actinoalloteichus]APU16878.1 hypothetical protein UA74_24315 [Actinoalloteichus fjordicus]APU22958.1 hypothetical protein UA75_24895 [Actinoalloteichus sp. GBA129-24]
MVTTQEEHTGDVVLSLGLHPSAVDFSLHPEITEETLTARLAAGEAAIRAAGFDLVQCLVAADEAEAERTIRQCVARRAVHVVMIGAGLRVAPEHTLLFERVVNLLNELVPGIVFCFNTSPENTIDALRRHARPGSGHDGMGPR